MKQGVKIKFLLRTILNKSKTMKKTLIILILSFGFCIKSAQAQTKEQTIQWLKAKTGNIHNPDFAKYYNIRFSESDADLFYSQCCNYGGSDVRHINFSKLTGANYVFRDNVYQIRLTGEVGEVFKQNSDGSKDKYFKDISEYAAGNTHINRGSYSVIEIWYAVSEEEIKKIKKAYEHLGKLCGANIVSDDLFKN
jgi:hypothetical protein